MNEIVELPLDVTGIQKLIPHRYPFLLVDRVLSYEPNKSIVAQKNVTYNEPYFQGHFPGQPVMPGVLIIEALAQAGGVLTQLSLGRDAYDQLFYMVKVDNVRFSKMVIPGDVLELNVEIKRSIRHMALYSGVATVAGEEVACAEVFCAAART